MSANLKRRLSIALALGLALVPLALMAGTPSFIPQAIHDDYPRMTASVLNQVLAAGVAETVTVPSSCDFIVFGATGTFYVRTGGTAAVPIADVTDGTGSEVSPSARQVVPASTFSIIAPATTVVSMACYNLP